MRAIAEAGWCRAPAGSANSHYRVETRNSAVSLGQTSASEGPDRTQGDSERRTSAIWVRRTGTLTLAERQTSSQSIPK